MKIQQKMNEPRIQMTGACQAVVFALAGQLLLTCHANAQTVKPPLPVIPSNALPTNGQVVAGVAGVSVNGSTMTINQASNQAIVNWNSFNVGGSAKVNIVQPGSNAVILNRVVGNDPTQIHGQINANGQVMLVNPNGVVIGKDGAVTATGFTASSYGMTDADFMAGKRHFTRNGTQAGVTNEGNIQVGQGGYVALIGAEVTNSGRISAPGGTVLLASGETVTVPAEVSDAVGLPLSKRVRINVSASTVNAAVNNTVDGVIVAESGQVLLQASAVADAVASVTHHGRIETSGDQAGNVTLLSDRGQLRVDGVIVANSSGSKNGMANKGGDIVIGRDTVTGVVAKVADVSGAKLESKGGFVETSGDYLKTDQVQVAAAQWLLDPLDVEIGTGINNGTSYINNTLLSTTLAGGTSVTITTSGAGGSGDIKVTAPITSANNSADSTLILKADRHINLQSNILATGSKKLNVELISAVGGAGGAILMNASTKIISNGGDIKLGGAGTIGGVGGYAVGFGASTSGIKLVGTNTLDARSTTVGAPAGAVVLKGASSEVGGNGVSISSATIKGASVNINGQSDKTTATVISGSTLEASALGGVSLTGTTGTASTGDGIQMNSTTVKSTALNSLISLNGLAQGNASVAAINLGNNAIDSAGQVDIKANNTFEGHGLWMSGGSVIANGLIKIEAYSNSQTRNMGAVGIATGATLSSMNGAISIYGESQYSSGVFFNDVNFKAGTNIDIKGVAHRDEMSVSGLRFVNKSTLISGWNNMLGAGSQINLTGNNTAVSALGSTLNTGKGLYLAAVLNLTSPGGSVLKSEQGGIYMDYKLNGTNTAYTYPDSKINILLGDLTLTAGTDASSSANILVMPSAFGLVAPKIFIAGTSKLTMTTLGMGNVTAGQIVNSGSGDVILGAGIAHLAGDTSGGQVVSMPGNSVTNSGTGKLYVYSGTVAGTIGLSSLNGSFSTLDSTTPGALNTAFNKSYGPSPLVTTSPVQVLFREAYPGAPSANPVNPYSKTATLVNRSTSTASTSAAITTTATTTSSATASSANPPSSASVSSASLSLTTVDLAKVASPLVISGGVSSSSSISLGGAQSAAFNLASAEQLALADCADTDDRLKQGSDVDVICERPDNETSVGE